MASSDRRFCTLCYDDGTSKDAVTWCTVCEVFLCEDCEKHHTKSRTSKEHQTMSTKDYDKLPKFMQEISSQCRDHQKTFELYCSFHACPCCVHCVTDKHQKCQEMKQLSEILKQIKTSASVQLFEKDLKNVKENFEEIIKYLNSRLNTSNTKKLKAAANIRSLKKSIDEFLNKIEQEIIDDLESKHSKITSDLETLLNQLEQRANQVRQLYSGFSDMTRLATELQMYVGLKEIEKTTSQAAQYIEDLKKGDNFEEKNLEVIISPSLLSMQQAVKSFGDININISQSTLQTNAGRKDQAQNLAPTYPGFEEIKPSIFGTLKIPKDMGSLGIVACRILPDGKFLIFVDHYNGSRLLLFGNDGVFTREIIKFTESPKDTCFVRNNTVAVTLGSGNQTVMVDIKKNKITKRIKLSHCCDAVASDGNILVISYRFNSTLVNLNDMSQTILKEVSADCITLFKGNIYGTNHSFKNIVCCYKQTGERLWTLRHTNIDSPLGLALDKHGFVYITSNENNSIVVVSPDGKICKTILSEADRINDPRAVDINRETGMMIVSTGFHQQSAIVYKL